VNEVLEVNSEMLKIELLLVEDSSSMVTFMLVCERSTGR
jgi:hypothetical protein